MDVTTVQLKKTLHKRFRILAAHNDKHICQLMEEAVDLLEAKYSNLQLQNQVVENNNEQVM